MRALHAVGILALGGALLTAPAAHAQGEPLAGSVCTAVTTNDPSGQVIPDETVNVGHLVAGPLVVGDLGDAFPIGVPPSGLPGIPTQPPRVSSGTLLCWIQFTGTYNYAAPDGRYSYPGPGPDTGAPPASGTGVLFSQGPVSYHAAVTADQYLCSAVIDVDGNSTNDWLYDANWVDPDTGQTTGALVPASSTPTPVCSLMISAG
ncbi:MAG TPA: hypothetical protein VFQ85_16495 [Mycobacteriales bacterium]|jgi:hypothetical protein|nr:hypothetical protein [Mycobacteriales bacterium]